MIALALVLATVATARAQNLLTNGDFSNGLQGWTYHVVIPARSTPGFYAPSNQQCLPSQDGNPFFALKVEEGADGYIEQPVALEGDAELGLRTWGESKPVTATVSVVDQNGVDHVLEQFRPPPLVSNQTCSGYEPVVKVYSVAGFAGQHVKIRLRATASGFEGSVADFDDVTLTLPPAGTHTPTPVTSATSTPEVTSAPTQTPTPTNLSGSAYLVKDIAPGPESSLAVNLTNVNESLYLDANDGTAGPQLWTSDGTSAGTHRVTDLPSSPPIEVNVGGSPGIPVAAGDILFLPFHHEDTYQLLKINDTQTGTTLLRSFPRTPLDVLTWVSPVGATLFFTAFEMDTGFELWKSDGTPDGTVLVKDIVPGPDWTTLFNPAPVGTRLFFFAAEGGSQYALWKSDGTDPGTIRIKQVDLPRFFPASTGHRLFFASGRDLWTSDGTPEGTVIIKYNLAPSDFYAVRDAVYFIGTTPEYGAEMWRSDGTTEGTHLLKDIDPGPADSVSNRLFLNSGQFYAQIDGIFFFVASNGQSLGLWKSDGTDAGTVLVKAPLDPLGGIPSVLTNVSGTLYFLTAPLGPGNSTLWKSNGTRPGTVPVAEVLNWTQYATPPFNCAFVGSTFFFAPDYHTVGREPWAIDLLALQAPCAGDCKGDGSVTVDELIIGVNIALGNAPLSQCNAVDADGHGEVTVNELIIAVNNSLNGCP